MVLYLFEAYRFDKQKGRLKTFKVQTTFCLF